MPSPSSQLNALTGQTFLITGAAQGIGKAVAKHFAACGAEVILLDKQQDALDATYDEILTAGSCPPIQLLCDLATFNEEQAQQIANQIDQHCQQGLSGLLHYAAQLGPLTLLEQYPVQHWQQVLQVNLTSAWLLTKALVPSLKQAASARVIFSSDHVGQQATAYWGAYAIAKAASDTLVKLWSDEYSDKSHMRFYAVDPGAVRTQLRAEAFPAEDPGTLASPESLVKAYHFLVSDNGAHLSGQVLSLNDLMNNQTWL